MAHWVTFPGPLSFLGDGEKFNSGKKEDQMTFLFFLLVKHCVFLELVIDLSLFHIWGYK